MQNFENISSAFRYFNIDNQLSPIKDISSEKETYYYLIGTPYGVSAKNSNVIDEMQITKKYEPSFFLGTNQDVLMNLYPEFVGKKVDTEHNGKQVGVIEDYFFNKDGFSDSKGNVYNTFPWIGQPIFKIKVYNDQLSPDEVMEMGCSSMEYIILQSEFGEINGIMCEIPKKILPKGLTITKKGISSLSNSSVVMQNDTSTKLSEEVKQESQLNVDKLLEQLIQMTQQNQEMIQNLNQRLDDLLKIEVAEKEEGEKVEQNESLETKEEEKEKSSEEIKQQAEETKKILINGIEYTEDQLQTMIDAHKKSSEEEDKAKVVSQSRLNALEQKNALLEAKIKDVYSKYLTKQNSFEIKSEENFDNQKKNSIVPIQF